MSEITQATRKFLSIRMHVDLFVLHLYLESSIANLLPSVYCNSFYFSDNFSERK